MKKLQNKKTGEIGCLVCSFEKTPEKITVVKYIDGKRGSKVWYYNSLTELNKDWEDYEEPEELYIVDGRQSSCGGILKRETDADWYDHMIELGLGFRTNKELEQAIEKLKAWKRLKDKGFQFESWFGGSKDISFWLDTDIDEDIAKDLDLLFGGE